MDYAWLNDTETSRLEDSRFPLAFEIKLFTTRVHPEDMAGMEVIGKAELPFTGKRFKARDTSLF